ncbi:rod shape-determining protein MreC, partial [Patescibacteria group bacterium]|nr:rod shape-determining protein MreC [Patescibacteria group bacterium]
MKYLAISVFLLILSTLHVTFPVTLLFNKAFGPAQKNATYYGESVKDFFLFFSQMRNVAKDYEDLYLEYQSLQTENVKLKYLKDENAQLRQQLKVVNSEDILKNKKFVFTYAFANPNDKSGNTMLMNAGTVSGVHKGDVVIKDTNLIGIVKNATSGRSILELITSPTLKIPVYNFSSIQKTEGFVSGKFGTAIVMENILPDEQVKEGDVLLTSTNGLEVPPNLIVGKIVRIEGGRAST